MSCSRSRNHSLSDDVDDLAIAAHRELDLAVRKCEQRVVLADAHVLARVEVGATLANQNVASHDASPPNFFTPRYWGFESRPLRELEAPFLCAISRSFRLAEVCRQ